ncbi:hypothetical protein [Saccharopolyspora sp. NPDC049357]|uniref:hypothetical protein n=1 Tax=Saccharopolyspora sp. NPDC049357 TaxID=3154507 RepID=UPI003434992E
MTQPRGEESPHIAAVRRSVDAGFQFLHLCDSTDRTVMAIHAQRLHDGVIETYTIRDMTEAVAARYRAEDYPNGAPLWQQHGTVEEVVSALLALPPHGTPDAPMITRRATSSLWLPGGG